MSLAFSACLLAILTSLACAIPGIFVVLKGESMVIDGIGHAVLPGIAVGYLFTADIGSPWLLLTAALGGLAVALLTEWLGRAKLVTGDASLGLVFPALFAFGTILISTKMSHVHLDVHTVLVGDLNLAVFANPNYLWVMLTVLIINAAFVAVAFPRLTASSFDAEFCRIQAIGGRGLHTAFMALVAFSATAAFHAAGAMLVIALMVFPAITARLLAHRVLPMLGLTCLVATGTAIAGFWAAYHLQAATSAAMTVANAVVFAAALGVYAWRSRQRSRRHI